MKRLLLILSFCAALAAPAHADAFGVFGTFKLPDGRSHVRISDCGDGTPCGEIVWLDAKSLPAGTTPATIKNDKGEKILGLKLLKGFQKSKRDWRGGTIYDPEFGKTYQSRLKRLENKLLEVKGCIGPICQTQLWSPVS